jgi:hypothetical protein
MAMRTSMMTLTLGAVVAVTGLGAQAPAGRVEPTTPSGCLAATTKYLHQTLKAMRPFDAEMWAAQKKIATKIASGCVAKLAVDDVPPAELTPLAELYIAAGQAAKADAAITRSVAAQTDPALKAAAVNMAIHLVFRQPFSAQRDARAEQLVDELEKLPASFVKGRIEGHGRLNLYYRATNSDAEIIRHSIRIIDLNKKLVPAERVPPFDLKVVPDYTGGIKVEPFEYTLVNAYVNLAEVLAGQEQNPKALDLLRRAPVELAGIDKVAAGRVKDVLARYELVGKPAAAIEAPQWLNVPAGTTTLDMKGQVTWLQFIPPLCESCIESYPFVVKMLSQYGAKAFRVVMFTQLHGFFGQQRGRAPADEIAALKTHFPLNDMAVPLAIGPNENVPSDEPVAPGTAPNDPNVANYKVLRSVFMENPQIQIIDKKGTIRLISVGYDPGNDARMADLIRRLLAEK